MSHVCRDERLPASIFWPFPLPGLIAPPKLPPDPMPSALLESFGITPSPIFFHKGDLLSARAILGDQIVSRSFDITYRDQSGSDT